jgi:hypothetical protein
VAMVALEREEMLASLLVETVALGLALVAT